MNNNWKTFYRILNKEERLIIGLMSGTSLDGLDIALCKVKGHGLNTDLKILKFQTVPYNKETKADIKAVFSKRMIDLQMITLMNEKIGSLHGEMILGSLAEWSVKPSEVDLIASHGQTIFHAPKSLHGMDGYPNATLQIGGGEGAPLAVYGDYLYFSKPGEIRIMLNIGGIANITYLPGDIDAAKIFSTDVGPGNTIMDQYVQANFEGMHYDVDGLIAADGEVNPDLLTALLAHGFFDLAFPKTTGPELFNLNFLASAQLASNTQNISSENVLATLNKFTAIVIAESIKRCTTNEQPVTVYSSGGGIHNKLLMAHLKTALPGLKFTTTDELGILPDAKEAVLFALLANETLMGEPIDFGSRSGLPSISMGKICLPF